MRKASATLREIELELRYSRGAVRKALNIVKSSRRRQILQRPRQKLKYNSQARRRMLYCLRNHLKITYAARRKTTGLTINGDNISELATTYSL